VCYNSGSLKTGANRNVFTTKETAYLQSQPLARLATVSTDLQPDIAAVSFQLEHGVLYISGHNLEGSRKYRNIAAGNARVAVIVDDLESRDPWRPRGIRIYGRAWLITRNGRAFLRIQPEISWSWNIEGPAFVDGEFITHRTVHRPPIA
jgi:pyridoxamine 5'-phosphate oxidase family protein